MLNAPLPASMLADRGTVGAVTVWCAMPRPPSDVICAGERAPGAGRPRDPYATLGRDGDYANRSAGRPRGRARSALAIGLADRGSEPRARAAARSVLQGQRTHPGQQLSQLLSWQVSAANDYPGDPPRVRDVLEGIRVREYQVCQLTRLDRPVLRLKAEKVAGLMVAA